ncbi:MAG: phosphotransferase [Alphaproteobacteria bacterium CG_4_9_14_3_um_filter_47_13]|nr:MAG: phosphotransferase [Alphaproteobacteria bacterium CG_4_9_14_3_um_filter_47_13]
MTAEFSIQHWFEDRADLRADFLRQCGWQKAVLSPVGEDCAFRRYFRLVKEHSAAILMEAVPDGNALASPGHSIQEFVRISGILRRADLHSPEIFAADIAGGYVLLEDFGDVSFKKALENGQDAEALYRLATDVLLRLRDVSCDGLPDYYQSHVHKGRQRIVDWYFPVKRKIKNPEGLVNDYLAVWQQIEKSLPPCPQGFLHIDFHLENLMWMPDQNGLAQGGILDFQGAMNGPIPYDLANLLEDARHDIPLALRRSMIDRYCTDMGAAEKEIFENWYRVLATQFHCRIAGQFIRLAVRDRKDRYLNHLPRVLHYLQEGLTHPVLAPLQQWFATQNIDFKVPPVLNPDEIKKFIRDDAF